MNQAYRDFGGQFAQAVIEQDYNRAWNYLAPWLQTALTPEQLKTAIDQQIAKVAESMEVEPVAAPGAYEIGENTLGIADLRYEADRSREYMPDQVEIPAEITEENFRQWAVINFLADPDDASDVDVWLDFWFSIVQLDGVFKIGHFEVHDPD